MRSIRSRVAALATLLLATTVPAAEPVAARKGAIIVSDAWTRPTGAGMPMGVAYFSVRNDGANADAIVAATTPAAAHVEFHQTTLADGMARMRPMKEIAVPAKGTVSVAPGNIHLMLVDLKAPLVTGARIPLVLEFRNAGKLELHLVVEARTD